MQLLRKGKFIVIEGIDQSGKKTQSILLRNRLKKNGYKVGYISFPKYNTNPEDIEMLRAISKCEKENNADIGLGFDGDGDRVGIIDNNGKEIYSDKVGLLIARNLAPNYKNKKFIVDVKSTALFAKDKILLENNCETIYWKTGHSHIKRKVNEVKALAGFEKSGHFFFNKPLGYGYDDGINSAIQVCRLLDNQNKKISEIINELPKTYQTPTMAPFCKDEEKYKGDHGFEPHKKFKFKTLIIKPPNNNGHFDLKKVQVQNPNSMPFGGVLTTLAETCAV